MLILSVFILKIKKFSALLYSLVPLQFLLKIFPDGGVSSGLEMVDEDETLLGVF